MYFLNPCERRGIIGTCFDTIHTNFNFDPYVNFDLECLTNAATSGPEKFFHNYLHICLQEYAESPFIRVCSRSNCIYPLLTGERGLVFNSLGLMTTQLSRTGIASRLKHSHSSCMTHN